MKVRHTHFRALGYCNRGARRWLADRGVSWAEFLRDGVDAEVLLASGDSMALKAVELAGDGSLATESTDNKRGGCI